MIIIIMNDAFMAEWSEALRSGRSIVVCVGSNPTAGNIIDIFFSYCRLYIYLYMIIIIYSRSSGPPPQY